jgi:hypothetical protein
MLGGLADLPLRLGGGPSPSAQSYNVIRKAVGKGGSAENDYGIDGLWRRSKAKALAAASSHVRRAFIQSNPLFASDTIPYYERILGIVPAEGASEAERREAIIPLWIRKIDATMPGVAAELVAIDPRFSIIEPDEATSIVVMPGRLFGTPGNLMNLPQEISAVGSYSSRSVLRVHFAQGYPGAPNATDRRVLDVARAHLREIVQSWESWTISTGPWVLGVTPIGLGSVGP